MHSAEGFEAQLVCIVHGENQPEVCTRFLYRHLKSWLCLKKCPSVARLHGRNDGTFSFFSFSEQTRRTFREEPLLSVALFRCNISGNAESRHRSDFKFREPTAIRKAIKFLMRFLKSPRVPNQILPSEKT